MNAKVIVLNGSRIFHKLPKDHAILEKLSGYPPCCRLAFRFRMFLMHNKYTRNYMKKRWDKHGVKNTKWQHIACWLHMALRRIGLYKVQYHTCKDCGWQQLNQQVCNVRHLH